MKVISYKTVFCILAFLSGSHLQAFDMAVQRAKRLYGEFVLGKDVYGAFINNERDLLNKPDVRPVIFEQKYKAPLWVVIGSNFYSEESLKDYARDIYIEIRRIFEKINGEIGISLFKAQISPVAYGEFYQQNLYPIIDERGASTPKDKDQIFQNINQAITYLNNYTQALESPTTDAKVDLNQQKKMNSQKESLQKAIEESITKLENLKNKKFISALERSHRKTQFQRFTDWIHSRSTTQE